MREISLILVYIRWKNNIFIEIDWIYAIKLHILTLAQIATLSVTNHDTRHKFRNFQSQIATPSQLATITNCYVTPFLWDSNTMHYWSRHGFPPWVDNTHGLFVVFNHEDQLYDFLWSGTTFTTFYQYLWYLMRRHIFAIRNNRNCLATTTETTVLKVTQFLPVMGKCVHLYLTKYKTSFKPTTTK